MNAANGKDVELNTRREISYLQATMYNFVHHINTIALFWLEESTLLMNENKRIDNPQIKIGKCLAHSRIKQALNHHKINNGRNCQYYKFLVINLGLADRNLSGTRPKSACGKSSRCRFLFSVARNAITKVTEYFTFGFSFRILVCKR